jgi:hypothetical protein
MEDEEIKVIIGHHTLMLNHPYTPEEWERTKTDAFGNFLHELPKNKNPLSKWYTPPTRWYLDPQKKENI